MRRTYYIWIAVLFILIASTILIVIRVKAQGDVVAELKTLLKEQGVPLQDIKITNRIRYSVNVIIQSSSQNAITTQDDANYEHIVQREVALTQKQQDLKLDGVQISIMNARGEIIYWSDVPVKNIADTSPSKLANGVASQWLRTNLETYGMSLESLVVSSDSNGWQTLRIRLVADIQTVNNALPQFMSDLATNVNTLNTEQGAQIVVYELNIVDNTSQPLMKYSKDLQLNQENWWQADQVTQEWFPHPAPATP